MQTVTMTGKYKRRPLQSNLEVRGVSRGAGGVGSYQEVLRGVDEGLIDRDFIDTVQDAISQFGALSDCSSPTTGQYLDTSNNNWTAQLADTGNTTDRSSSYSTVTYDDFDREASMNVQRLFDDINSTLYENDKGSTCQLSVHNECKDWSESFPHLRVLGHQVLASSEQGHTSLESTSSSTASSADPHTRSDNSTNSFLDSFSYGDASSLVIEGSHVRAQVYSASSTTSTSTLNSDMSYLTEEVFEIDGYYEDIIAVDSDQHEEATDSKAIAKSQRQRRSRYPPITPNACAKDDVTNSAFDSVWHILTDVVRILLQRYSEHFIITHPMAIAGAEEVEHDDGHLKLPQILMSGSRLDNMTLPMVPSSHRHAPGSVLSRPMHVQPNPASDQLWKLLHISKMEMTARERTFLEDDTETPVSMMTSTRDVTMMKGKPNGARNMSATRKGHVRGKPLLPIDSRVRTPNVDDEVHGIRGISVGKRIGSPPFIGSRTLPPIHQSESTVDRPTDPTPSAKAINKRGNRASSAIAEETRLPFRDKAAIIAETRPSTTHTIYPAPDQSHSGVINIALNARHGSSTPLDRPNIRLKSDVSLGITGSSLIGPHPVLDEEVEGRYETVPNHSQWGPPHTATGGYRRKGGGGLSSVVR